MSEQCEHKWQFQHVVYWSGRERPGSGARDRHYGDKFFCERCLTQKIVNERINSNDYNPPLPGTFPR